MKTAVEWYDTQLKELDYKLQSGLINWTQCKSLMVEAREQALEMYKDQIKKAYLNGRYDADKIVMGHSFYAKQYYNETFKQEEQ